jgi:hypothetical protein
MTAEIKFEIYAPAPCTKEEFEEWLDWSLKIRHDISNSNPLADYDFDLQEMKTAMYPSIQIS